MRFPTGHEVTKLRGSERNFSRAYLGVQRGKERTDAPVPLMVGMHYAIIAADAYDDDEHYLTFNAINFLRNSDIRPNMTLAVGTLADPFLHGSARIREVDIVNNRLCLEPNNLEDEGFLATGNYIWVDGVYRLYRKLPYIVTGTVFEDGNPDTLLIAAGIPGYGLPFLDLTSGNPDYMDRPIALMGSPRFAWTGENVDFYGWRSHGRGGNTIQNWTWDFDGGVCTGPGLGFPGSPASPIHARWNTAGEYVASLVVEDNSGRAQIDDYGVPYDRHRAVRPVLVYDRPGEGDNTPYSDFEIESLTGNYGSGWTAKVKVFGTADKSEFPDNALIILYAEDWYGDEQGSIGGWYGQEGILFCGYIRADSVTVDFEKSTVTFTAQTIEQWMKDISIWPANCVSTAGAPTRWQEFQDMTVEDVLWYLSEFRSNLKDITDCFFASDVNTEKTLGFVDLTEASLYDQMSQQLGSCFFGKLSASRHGSVHLSKHKNMLDRAERSWWGPPVYSFARQDWEGELQIGEERQRDSVAQVDFVGFVYDANGNPLEVYSLAPERQTNFGRIVKVDGILLSGNSIGGGQAESNTLAGLFLAWQNIRFPHISFTTRVCNRVLEPSCLDYFSVVLDDTVRGLAWEGKEFLTTSVDLSFDHESGVIETTVNGEASTWGPDGVAGPYPPGPPPDDPPNDNPSEYWPDWPPGATPDDPGGDPPLWPAPAIAFFVDATSGRVFRCTDYHGTPTYEDLGVVSAAGLRWIELDKFKANTAMVAGPSGIWKTTDLDAAIPTWVNVLDTSGGTLIVTMVRSSEVQRDLWMACGYDDANDRIKAWYSLDGLTFTLKNLANQASYENAKLEMSTHSEKLAWITWYETAQRRAACSYCTISTWGIWGTFYFLATDFEDAHSFRAPCLHHRYLDNDDEELSIWGGVDITGVDQARIASVDGANPPTDIVALTTLHTADISNVLWIGCYRQATNRYWALTYNAANYEFFNSNDAVNWTSVHTFAGICHYVADWPFNDYMFMATNTGTAYPLLLSMDRGDTWTPKPGNWADLGLVADPGCVVLVP